MTAHIAMGHFEPKSYKKIYWPFCKGYKIAQKLAKFKELESQKDQYCFAPFGFKSSHNAAA